MRRDLEDDKRGRERNGELQGQKERETKRSREERQRDMVMVGVCMQIHVRGGGKRQTKVGQEERHSLQK